MIAGVNNPSPASANERHYGNGQPAIQQMRQWLTEVYDATQNLNTKDVLERVVKSMLTPHATQRISMAEVLKELAAELSKAS
jgi:isochorismate synthase EntC